MISLQKLMKGKLLMLPVAMLAVSLLVVGCGDDDTTNTTIEGNQPATTADLTAEISGRVIDSSTGEGIAGVSVSAAGVTTTTSDGVAPNPPAGSYTLAGIPRTEANSPVIISVTGAPANYPDTTNAVVGLIGEVIGAAPVEPNVVVAGVEIELHDQGGTINGQILDFSGNPAEGVAITLDAVQIPVFTPSTVDVSPSSGVQPFTLTAANSRATTDANGNFSITGVPEDWTYNIIVRPQDGVSANITFTNQFVPSGSTLNFPDVVGSPVDSSVNNALALAGAVGVAGVLPAPTINGVLLPCAAGACPVGPGPIVGASPVAVIPPVLPGDSPDVIAPYVQANSEIVDGTVIAAADNTAGRSLSFIMSEPLGNSVADLANNLRLVFVGGPGTPLALGATAAGTAIPIQVVLDGTVITLTPDIQIPDPANPAVTVPGPLSAGVYQITGLGTLADVAGNLHSGLDANGALDASSTGGVDNDIDFTVLGDTTLPGAPAIANIVCTNCNNGNPAAGVTAGSAFTVNFNAVTGATMYTGAFATEGDDTFTFMNGAGAPFTSPGGQLADPPERIAFTTDTPPGAGGPGVPQALTGFGFPLVAGTTLSNNYFDDGIQYQAGVQAINRAGIAGPLVAAPVGDVVAPSFDVSGAAGTGDDISNRVGAAAPGGNTTTAFTPLLNVFSTSSMGDTVAESIPMVEGSSAIGGTVGFDFFMSVVGATPVGTGDEMGIGGAVDAFYSETDLMALTSLAGSLNIRINEDIDTTLTLTAPVLSNPSLTGLFTATGAALPTNAGNPDADDGTVSIQFWMDTDPVSGVRGIPGNPTQNGDGINDEDLVRLTFSNVFLPDTGDNLDFSASNIRDEAGNPLGNNTITGATTSLTINNQIAAAIARAEATRTATNDVLTLEFTRPIVPLAAVMGLLNTMGELQSDLGLQDVAMGSTMAVVNNALVGGTTSLSTDARRLAITTPLGSLSGLTATTVITGNGAGTPGNLQTDDAWNFLAGGPLNVNVFPSVTAGANSPAGILVTDRIPAALMAVNDVGGTINTGAPVNNTTSPASGTDELDVGDVGYAGTLMFVFDSPVLSDTNMNGMIDAGDVPANVSLTFTNPAGATTEWSANVSAVNPPNDSTILFNVTVNAVVPGTPVTTGTVFTVNNLTDLSGLPVSPNRATLGAAGGGITIP